MNQARAPIDSLQQAMGKAIEDAVDRQGGKVAVAKEAGLNRATLYRLLAGENVSTEVLLRTLRALGRNDLLTQLITTPDPTPLERLPRDEEKAHSRKQPAQSDKKSPAQKKSPLSRLKLARPTGDQDG